MTVRVSRTRRTPGKSRLPLRILIVSHGHPEFARGGAEISAFNLFAALRQRSDCESWFLGCRPSSQTERRLGVVIEQPFSDREFLYHSSDFDWFRFANRDPAFPAAFTELLNRINPDVVHFHHFANLGVEAFLLVRRALPNARIVLTVHEFLLICHHYGQMVTKPRLSLCHRASLARCHDCFPALAESDFFLRNLYVRHFLTFVDRFVAPSAFLAGRLTDWGVPAEKLQVIENVTVSPQSAEVQSPARIGRLFKVGFFGQVSPLKGIDVLLDAAMRLDSEQNRDIVFHIHGDYRTQPEEFQERVAKRLDEAVGNVQFHGPYDSAQVNLFMSRMDVILVPSIWWENSPVVIQEAFYNRRPVVCSDIGGMAEKVREGKDGWHFAAGSSADLVALLKELAGNPELLRRIGRTLRKPAASDETVEMHMGVYG